MYIVQLAAGQIVQQVLEYGRNLNQALDISVQKKSAWTPAQRAALKDLSYGTLRFYGQLHAILSLLLHKPLSDQRINYLLLVTLYQLQYSKAAHHVIVDHAVRAAQILNVRMGGLVNAILRNFLRNQPILLDRAKQRAEGKYNYQQWWIDELQEQYAGLSASILEAGNQHPPMTLRVNQRYGTTEEYSSLIVRHGLSVRNLESNALQLERPIGVDKLPGFYDGLVSVQDAGAQYAAGLLDIQDGMRVLDACAAPGGKTAHILECNEVEMTALDKDERRLHRVADNLQRLGLNAQLLVGDASDPATWWDGTTFQRILADVPCSASGVVRRHPDIKWLRRRADIAGFAGQQLAILNSLWRLLEHDGKLLYATCSIFKQENEQVIEAFMAQQPDATRLLITLPMAYRGQLLPNDQHDGFYYALLHKRA